ncbi:MAG TPA: phage portal protein, partial [Firmicutes bacterium]|nr:phage portal protein [Bacillota bacterium]
MNLLTLFRKKPEERATLRDPDGWRDFLGLTTAAGVTVTPDSALGHPAVLGACRLLAELTASLPLLVYERTADGRRRAENHPVYRLLHEAPNPQQTPFTWKEELALHLLLYGNAYVLVGWAENGSPAALWPLHPSRVQTDIQPSGTVLYKVTTRQGQPVTYTPDDILHIPLLALDGLVGRSPIQLARESIGAALAAEAHAAGYFGNAATPSGVLKVPGRLAEEAALRLKKSWQQAYGQGKAGTAVLEDGIEFQPIAGTGQEAQLIESRQFAMRALAAALRIPPHLLDPTARGTYANVETQSLEFLTFSLQPFLTRLEEALTLKLFTPAERRRYFVEFLTDGLLRVDTRTRYQAYQVAIQSGFMTANEARQRENLPPLPETPPPASPSPERADGLIETRATKKQAIQAKHKANIEQVARRVLAKERADVLALAEKALGRRDMALAATAIGDYYQGSGWIAAAVTPAFGALAREAHLDAAEDVAAAPWSDTAIDEFVTALATAYAAKHAAISQATLLSALRTAGSEDAVMEALEATLADMETTRPAKAAALQAANIANEAALRTYQQAG